MTALPDRQGFYGRFGGKFVPETLMAALDELESAYKSLKREREFRAELDDVLAEFVGRPTALTRARKFAELCGGLTLYLKREDLNHTGAHKINNCLGQILLARRMGKTRIIAETGAGQHGVATATVAARSVRSPLVTGTTFAPSRRMRPTFGAWRSISTSPM